MTHFSFFFCFLFSFSFFGITQSSANIGMTENQNYVSTMIQTFKDNKGQRYLALFFQNEEGWHTYWKNPGDAGTPFSHSIKIGDREITPELVRPLEWPIPKRYNEQGGLQAYGYTGIYGFFFSLPSASQGAAIKTIQGKELTIHSKWLVCKNICIPGEKVIKGTLQGLQGSDATFSESSPQNGSHSFSLAPEKIEEIFASVPQKNKTPSQQLFLALDLSRTTDGQNLLVTYSLKGVEKQLLKNRERNILTPFPNALISFKHEELNYDDKEKTLHGRMQLDWDGLYAEGGPIELPSNGRFKVPLNLKFLFDDPRSSVSLVEKNFRQFDLEAPSSPRAPTLALPNKVGEVIGEEGKKKPFSLDLNEANAKNEASETNKAPEFSWIYFFLAFLGGFILNFMPCVLPVISLKLFSLVKASKEGPKIIMRHNLSYTLGVITSFLVLGGVITLLKMGGDEVGWGFHLQSPFFVGVMILILFIMGLNLFGLFEFRTPGGQVLGGVTTHQGFWGDFLSGVLSTILSTPCSAPFLGTALAFAFTSSPFFIMLIFFFIGLGLSTPFLVTAFFPQPLKLLPRPGMWMEDFKRFLGLTIFLTLIWLYDVFQGLISSSLSIMSLNLTLLIIFFFFYYRKHIGSKGISQGILLTLTMTSLIFFFKNISDHNNPSDHSNLNHLNNNDANWSPWSENAMTEAKNSGQVVFIDFTAKWCFTCRVNEKLVLNTDGFQKLAQTHSLKLMIGDWTKRDPQITQWLKKQNIFGVPAYFIQGPTGNIIPLGETISLSEIEDVLKKI